MPTLTVRMVRAALLWQGSGFSLGELVLAEKGLGLLPWIWTLRGAHIHILLMGWPAPLATAGSRGDERPVWAAYRALNLASAPPWARGGAADRVRLHKIDHHG
jgi:hypothetical protein